MAMVHLNYSIRYLTQLRKTRPSVVAELQNSVLSAIQSLGGTVSFKADSLRAEFDNETIAFGLDLVLMLEAIATATVKAEAHLFGRVCLVTSAALSEGAVSSISRSLSLIKAETGIWCDSSVVGLLAGYATFGDGEGYRSLRSFEFRPLQVKERDPSLAPVIASLSTTFSDAKSTWHPGGYAVLGSPRGERRMVVEEALRPCCGDVVPPLLRFYDGRSGYAELADCLAENRSGLPGWGIEKPVEGIRERRLSSRLSACLRAELGRVFSSYLARYGEFCRELGCPPIVLVEGLAWVAPELTSLISQTLGRADSPVCPVYLCEKMPTGLEAEPRVLLEVPETSGPSDKLAKQIWQAPSGVIPEAIPDYISDDILEIAYAFSLVKGLFPVSWLRSLLEDSGKSREVFDIAVEKLSLAGIIVHQDDPSDTPAPFASFAADRLGPRSEVVRSLVLSHLLTAERERRLKPGYEFLALVCSLGGRPDGDLCIRSAYYDATCDASITTTASQRDKSPPYAPHPSFDSLAPCPRPAALQRLYVARVALVSGDAESAAAAFSGLAPDQSQDDRYRDMFLMDSASYEIARNNGKVASETAKGVVIRLQQGGYGISAARAYRVLGESEIAAGQVDEGAEYFDFASDAASRSGNGYEMLLADVSSAIANFLKGNYSRAHERLRGARGKAQDDYRDSWGAWLCFLDGRISFEIGHYGDAARLFSEAAEYAAVLSGRQASGLCNVWKSRALAYQGSYLEAEAFIDEDTYSDGRLFMAESCLLRNDPEMTLAVLNGEVLDSGLRFPIPSPRSPRTATLDRVEWMSGFAMVEERLLGESIRGRNVYEGLELSYRTLAQALLDGSHAHVDGLRTLVKEDRPTNFDPNAPIYAFCLYRALEAGRAEVVDRATVLSTAFKRLQARASRIENIDYRRSYVGVSLWNAQLMAESRAHKLI